MIVFDNIIFRWQKSGGISVVWYELLKRISDKTSDYKILEYNKSKETNSLRAQLHIPQDKITVLSDRFFFIKRYLNTKVNIQNQFIHHSSYYRICNNKNAINIITIHDFTYEYFEKGLSKFIHCYTKYNAIKKADYIICVSENTRKDLFKFVHGIQNKNIRVIYNGVSDDYYYKNSKCKRYLLFVGSRAYYKNFRLAVEVAEQTKMQLIICGSKLTEDEKKYLDNKIPGNYHDKGFVDNKELNSLYNEAFCLLYLSSYEGFGIPAIEAQKAGCPVLALNCSSIPEVIGYKELLVDNLCIKNIIEKIKLLENHTFRESIISKGLDFSKKFSWDKTFNKYYQLYQEISVNKC